MTFLDRLRRRSPSERPGSLTLPEPSVATRPGTLPSDGPALVGDVPLPAGRCVAATSPFAAPDDEPATTPTLWISDDPCQDAVGLWRRLVDAFPTTGLWPLVLGSLDSEPTRPWDDGELAPATEADLDGDALEILARGWQDGATDADGGDEADGADEAMAPFGRAFPGLTAAQPEPTVEPRLPTRVPGLAPGGRIGLVPCRRPADAIALIGWLGSVNVIEHGPLAIVLRSWEERFGAVLLGLEFDVATLVLRRPPRSREDALAFAAEITAVCPDAVWQGVGTLEALATAVTGSHVLSLWWD